MARKYLTFDTVPCRGAADGGYRLQLRQPPMLAERAAYREAVQSLSLNLSEDTVAFLVEAVLRSFAKKVSQDGVPRHIGNLLKFAPVLRGTVPGVSSPYDPRTAKTGVAVTALKGLSMGLDEENLAFVNSRPEKRITVAHFRSQPSTPGSDGVICRGLPIAAYGTNLVFRAELGDHAEVSWCGEDGGVRTAALVSPVSDYLKLDFDWPEALQDVPSGTKLTFTLTLRGGVENAAPRQKCIVCILKDA